MGFSKAPVPELPDAEVEGEGSPDPDGIDPEVLAQLEIAAAATLASATVRLRRPTRLVNMQLSDLETALSLTDLPSGRRRRMGSSLRHERKPHLAGRVQEFSLS
jgi:hypothetical protein